MMVERKAVYLPPPKRRAQLKTIFFDLDETLVHCVEDNDLENPEIILEIKFPNGETAEAGINVRPFAIECLREASKRF